MNAAVQPIVELIHASPTRTVIALSGAGGQALAWILSVPGASRTVLEAVVPYSARSMEEFLGHRPARYVSTETAREMAAAAYGRAVFLGKGQQPLVGLGCTATIATDRPKRGEHRCCIATWDNTGVDTYSLKLVKGLRDRPGEEEVVSRLVVGALARSCGVEVELSLGLLPEEQLEVDHADLIRQLLAGGGGTGPGNGVRTVTVYPDGGLAVNQPFKGCVLPGSFSPLHDGHRRLARVASEMLGGPVALEISVMNVDKPPLDEVEVRRRISLLQGGWCVILTRAPTFREKAALFPGCTFVIGWDTAVRLFDPQYHRGEQAGVLEALEEIRAAGCSFLVGGRLQDGAFRTLADVAIPQDYSGLFKEIPESRFRADTSSTELRSAKRPASMPESDQDPP